MRASRERVLGLLEPDESPARPLVAQREPAEMEVSVVLPVRNEAESLRGCLDALLEQSEAGFLLGRQWEIVVVDDASTDRTREIAADAIERAHGLAGEQENATWGAGISLLDAPPWDARGGMTGKSSACWTGAQRARGGRLLFLDAGCRLGPGALSRSLREADRHETALLSYSPRELVSGVLSQVTLPLIVSEVVSVYPPAQVNDPARPLAAGNGRFLLVDRDAYFDAGGHRAAGEAMLEGHALARRVKQAGGALRLRYAPEAVSTRPRTGAEMMEGFTRSLAGLMPSPLALAGWRVLDLLLLFGLPVLALVIPHLVLWQRAALLLLWLRTGLRFYTRAARAQMGWWATAISPLGLPLFVVLLLRSTWAYRVARRVMWKGRAYNPNVW